MAKSLKILICGDVEGHFHQLYKRIRSIQKKAGQFDMLFCVGNFFGADNSEWAQYQSGEAKAAVDTYVLGPCKGEHGRFFSDPNGCDLCENITYLGKKGLFTGSSGLQVAYLSGLDGCTIADADTDVHFSNADASSLKEPLTSESTFHGVDILLSSCWPRGVNKYASPVEGLDASLAGSMTVSQLALALRPRYHFSGLEGVYYERQPYRNHMILQENARHVTRFLGLAKVGNSHKKKYLYAFNIVPLKHMEAEELTKQAEDVTECPFKLDPSLLRPAKHKEEKSAQFFYDQMALDKGDVNASRKGQGRKRPHGDRDGAPPRKHAQPSGPCWFCLASPEVEKHLVVSVGDQSYVALAKGAMTEDHVLILPIGHHQSMVQTPTDISQEIEQYKDSLRKYYKSLGQVPVFFERNYKTSHLQIQVVPIAADAAADTMEVFQECAVSQAIELYEIPKHSDLKQIVPAGAPYFYTELPTGEKLLHKIKKGFQLNFGREALAHDLLLNMPERIDWRDCKITKPEEIALASKFKDSFKEFDFNMM